MGWGQPFCNRRQGAGSTNSPIVAKAGSVVRIAPEDADGNSAKRRYACMRSEEDQVRCATRPRKRCPPRSAEGTVDVGMTTKRGSTVNVTEGRLNFKTGWDWRLDGGGGGLSP